MNDSDSWPSCLQRCNNEGIDNGNKIQETIRNIPIFDYLFKTKQTPCRSFLWWLISAISVLCTGEAKCRSNERSNNIHFCFASLSCRRVNHQSDKTKSRNVEICLIFVTLTLRLSRRNVKAVSKHLSLFRHLFVISTIQTTGIKFRYFASILRYLGTSFRKFKCRSKENLANFDSSLL